MPTFEVETAEGPSTTVRADSHEEAIASLAGTGLHATRVRMVEPPGRPPADWKDSRSNAIAAITSIVAPASPQQRRELEDLIARAVSRGALRGVFWALVLYGLLVGFGAVVVVVVI